MKNAPFSMHRNSPAANSVRKEDEEKMRKLTLTIAIAMMTAFAIGSSLTDGLVGYWPFDGNANDMSGNGNNGVVRGATPTSDRNGTANHAFHFGGYYSDGFKDVAYIEVPNSQSLYSISSSFTLMAWIRIDKWCHNGGTGIENWASIICKGYSTLQYSLQIEGNDHKYWYGVTASPITVSVIPGLKVWRHVALTKKGNRLSAYINGNKVASGDIEGTVSKTTESLYFGMDNPGKLEYFNGAMDEVYIFNRALSAAEIRAIQHNKLNDEEFYVVSYHPNANDVVGDMLDQSFDVDKKQKLSKNTFRKDGYVFQGWAETTDGSVKYKDEAEITVDSDMTLYAVWVNPPLTLTAESANWSSGSITLRCEDADTSGAAHTYSLEYKNESGIWTNVNDAAANNIAVSADGFAHLTDNTFWSRLGGVPPVEYRVKDENGRVSAGCITRNRHAILVGLSKWSYDDKLPKLSGADDVDNVYELIHKEGGFSDSRIRKCVNATANIEDVNDAFSSVS